MSSVKLYNLLKPSHAEIVKKKYPLVYKYFGPGHGYRSFLDQMQLIKSKQKKVSTDPRLKYLK